MQTLREAAEMFHLLDALGFAVSCALFLGHIAWMKRRTARDPSSTVQGTTAQARAAWVESVMRERRDILAVQTLRNSTMAATFMASTAILLTVGVLTLTNQSDRQGMAWHALNVWGSRHEGMLAVKFILLLVNLFASFFCFSTSVRLFNHVGYMINAQGQSGREAVPPGLVAAQLNRAGHFYTLGMRGFYCMVPLVLWFFGPEWLVAATACMVVLLHRLDSTPAGWRRKAGGRGRTP